MMLADLPPTCYHQLTSEKMHFVENISKQTEKCKISDFSAGRRFGFHYNPASLNSSAGLAQLVEQLTCNQ